ncbi:MAG: sulfate reduction electron transfer complex DsrMKJOP subunit DsrJ [Acidobacteriota bacterium]
MYNAKYIIPGLIIFLALVLFPFIKGVGQPELKVETEKPKDVKECIMKTEKMRDVHMVLLNEWRDDVIRNGNRVWKNEAGKEFNMSLTNTCMGCHENKDKFCDKCHVTVGVNPYCWTCHNTSPVKKEGGK